MNVRASLVLAMLQGAIQSESQAYVKSYGACTWSVPQTVSVKIPLVVAGGVVNDIDAVKREFFELGSARARAIGCVLSQPLLLHAKYGLLPCATLYCDLYSNSS